MKEQATLTKTTSTTRGKKYSRYVVSFKDEGGSRKRKTFSDKGAAESFKRQAEKDMARLEARRKLLTKRIGEDAKKLSADHLRDAVKALAILEGRASLAEAARFLVNDIERRAKDIWTVAAAVDRYLADSEAHNLRPGSIQELKVRLNRFARTFGKRRVDEVTRQGFADWLESLRRPDGKILSVRSRTHYRHAVGGLFNFCIEHEQLSINPAAKLTNRKRNRQSKRTVDYTCEIFTPDEARRLLNAAVEHLPDMIAPLALGLFAGIRTAEIRRLEWQRHVDLSKGLVKITADIAKKRACRNVDISQNLTQWLALAPDRTGRVASQSNSTWTRRLKTLIQKAGLDSWPHNGMRHSFGSYHLEHFQDAKRTALQMGHVDGGGLLFDHYRQLTSREDAAKYWTITPEQSGAVLQFHGVPAGCVEAAGM